MIYGITVQLRVQSQFKISPSVEDHLIACPQELFVATCCGLWPLEADRRLTFPLLVRSKCALCAR